MKKYICIYTLILIPFFLNAQHNTVLVSNSEDNNKIIKVKWFHEDIIADLGCNVYRRESEHSEWIKLNISPILKGNYIITESEKKADSTLMEFVDMVKPLKSYELEGFGKAMVLIKMVQSEPFAFYLGNQYHDHTAIQGKSYQYKITKKTFSGEVLIASSETITIGKFIPAPPPDSIQVSLAGTSTFINWKVDPFRFYGVNIYRKSMLENEEKRINEKPILIAKRSGENGEFSYPETFFTDKNLMLNIDYEYRLTALDFFGREGQKSKIYKVKTRDSIPPLPPQKLKCKVSDYQISLSWSNTTQEDIAGVDIYRSFQNENNYTKINTSPLSLSVYTYNEELREAGFYYYYVTNSDQAGNTSKSNTATAQILDIIPPAKPQNLLVVSDTGVVHLSWQANKEPDLIGYFIYRTIDKNRDQQFVLITPEVINATRFTDSLPKNAKNKFIYRIVALDSTYNKSKPSNIAGIRLPDPMPPVQPYIKNVRVDFDKIIVEWIPNVELDLLGYNIYRKSIVDSTQKPQKINLDYLPPYAYQFTDRWAKANTDYTYTLVAIDSSFNASVPSKPYNAKIIDRSINILSEVSEFKPTIKKKSLVLEWQIKETGGYLGAVLYKKDNQGIYKPITSVSKVKRITDPEVTPGSSYHYQLKLYHQSGQITECKEQTIKFPALEEKSN